MYCCDYNAAAAAARVGLVGKREYGGAYLCLECLGTEYRDEDDLEETETRDIERTAG